MGRRSDMARRDADRRFNTALWIAENELGKSRKAVTYWIVLPDGKGMMKKSFKINQEIAWASVSPRKSGSGWLIAIWETRNRAETVWAGAPGGRDVVVIEARRL